MHKFGTQGAKPEGKEWERSAGICQGPGVLLRPGNKDSVHNYIS